MAVNQASHQRRRENSKQGAEAVEHEDTFARHAGVGGQEVDKGRHTNRLAGCRHEYADGSRDQH